MEDYTEIRRKQVEMLKHIEKINNLKYKIDKDLNIDIPKYIVDEILVGGYKSNIIALTCLAVENNSMSREDGRRFKLHIDKYVI